MRSKKIIKPTQEAPKGVFFMIMNNLKNVWIAFKAVLSIATILVSIVFFMSKINQDIALSKLAIKHNNEEINQLRELVDLLIKDLRLTKKDSRIP